MTTRGEQKRENVWIEKHSETNKRRPIRKKKRKREREREEKRREREKGMKDIEGQLPLSLSLVLSFEGLRNPSLLDRMSF